MRHSTLSGYQGQRNFNEAVERYFPEFLEFDFSKVCKNSTWYYLVIADRKGLNLDEKMCLHNCTTDETKCSIMMAYMPSEALDQWDLIEIRFLSIKNGKYLICTKVELVPTTSVKNSKDGIYEIPSFAYIKEIL